MYVTSSSVVDLEWKMIYVGSAESEEYDQVLDSVFVGPIPEGKHMFVFQVRKAQSLSQVLTCLFVGGPARRDENTRK